METMKINVIEVLITIGLIYGILKYWNWKLIGGYDIERTNKALGIFMLGQLLNVLAMSINSVDPQVQSYMENMSFFGSGALDLWAFIGISVFGLSILFMLSNVIGVLIFNVGFKSENGLFEEIRDENISSTIVASAIIFAVGFTSSYFILRPFILDWVSSHAGLIPLNMM